MDLQAILLWHTSSAEQSRCATCAGQDQAVNAVADAVLRSRAGLASRTRGSSFLFLGPTGVGKTELAKALAELLFDDEKMMVRLDMSEYMEVRCCSNAYNNAGLLTR